MSLPTYTWIWWTQKAIHIILYEYSIARNWWVSQLFLLTFNGCVTGGSRYKSVWVSRPDGLSRLSVNGEWVGGETSNLDLHKISFLWSPLYDSAFVWKFVGSPCKQKSSTTWCPILLSSCKDAENCNTLHLKPCRWESGMWALHCWWGNFLPLSRETPYSFFQ